MEKENLPEERQRGRQPKQSTKRTKAQAETDIAYCSNMFLRGYTYRAIADALNKQNHAAGLDYTITHQNVFRDIKMQLIEWKKKTFANINDYVIRELEKLDKIEAEMWEAWEKSKTGKLKTKSRDSKKPKKLNAESDERDYYGYTEEANETSAGNPKFMDIILTAQQRRAKLLGYDSAVKVDISANIDRAGDDKPKYNVSDIPKELLFVLADKMQNAEAVRIAATKGLPN
jgi:hypothetical protein